MRRKRSHRTGQSVAASRIRAEQRTVSERLVALDRGGAGGQERPVIGDNTPMADTLEEAQAWTAAGVVLAARQVLATRLRGLARARKKLREGSYGFCDGCGDPIPPRRLQVLPEAVFCVPCAEASERRPPSGLRRVR